MDRQNTAAAASQESLASLMSLQQLEPSPIESPLDLEQQLQDLPDPGPVSRTPTLGLSGNGHGSVYYLTRLQRYSSYTFSIFMAFHVANTSVIPLLTQSVPASESYLLLTRPYYQSPLLEPLLISLPLATHIFSGLALRVHRRNLALKRFGISNIPVSERLSRKIKVWPTVSYGAVSGYVLTPLVLGHVVVNRILPWWIEGGSSGVGLGFVSHGFAKHPILATVGYAALVGIAAGHIVWGWTKWFNLTPSSVKVGGDGGKKGRRRWWMTNGVAALVTVTWMAGAIGVVGRGGRSEGWVGKGFDEIYAHIPLLDL